MKLMKIGTSYYTVPVWRNWQTHLTQNQADNLRAGSSPATGINLTVQFFNWTVFYFFIKKLHSLKKLCSQNTNYLLSHEFLFCGNYLFLFNLLHRIPALLRHFCINLILQAKCIVKSLSKCFMHLRCRGLDSSMHH